LDLFGIRTRDGSVASAAVFKGAEEYQKLGGNI
jgi:hypothetical protein